jgi:hypothetical protein
MKFFTRRLRWFALGAAVAWLFDPELGAGRRTRLSKRASELLRSIGIEVDRGTAEEPGWAPPPEPRVPVEQGFTASQAS